MFARFYTGDLFHFSEFIFQTDFTKIQTPSHSLSHGVGHEREKIIVVSALFLQASFYLVIILSNILTMYASNDIVSHLTN